MRYVLLQKLNVTLANVRFRLCHLILSKSTVEQFHKCFRLVVKEDLEMVAPVPILAVYLKWILLCYQMSPETLSSYLLRDTCCVP